MVVARVSQDALGRIAKGLRPFDARVDDQDREHVFVRHEFTLGLEPPSSGVIV